jgi:hypothetical protein
VEYGNFCEEYLSVLINYGYCNTQLWQAKEKLKLIVSGDTTITCENAFSRLNLDSMQLETFISKAGMPDSVAIFMRNFYNSRNFHPAGFNEEGLSEPAQFSSCLGTSHQQIREIEKFP